MATKTWNGGAGDGDWNTASNWTGGLPIANDDVIINDTSQDITVGPSSAIDLASLTVGDRYTGNFTATITLGTITQFNYSSGGSYGKFSMTVTNGNIDIDRQRTLYIEGGAWGGTHLLVARGTIQSAAAATLANVENGEADWIIYSNATKITRFINRSGRIVTNGRSVEAYYGMGGSLSLRDGALISDGAGGGIAHIGPGATLSFDGTGGTHDTIRNMGVIDTRGAKSSQTITSLYRFPGSVVYEDVPGLSLTVTNDYKIGGSVSGSVSPVSK